MTSLGARVDKSINSGRGPYVFKISGQLYHWIGSLCPSEREPPRFLQLYIYDTDNELFRTSRENFKDTNIPNFNVRLYNVIGAREYELPTGDMLGVIDGYQKEMKMVGSSGSSSEQKRLTMLAYYSYYLHDHANRYNYVSRAGRLFQQYVVTAFYAVEQNRIDFIREHHNDIRNEYLSGIYDPINRGENNVSDCGSRLILPQSFTGGPRYMVDVVDRVFEMKIHQFVTYLRDSQPFGKVMAVLYTVEFQKRGLPRCHTLMWLDESVRIRRDEDIDIYISAELPLPSVDPEGYRIVSELMMHGPCGLANPSATCMPNSAWCKKNFSKEYCNRTYVDKSGFVYYKRRDVGATMMRQGVELDNGYVVPYNRRLLTTFYAHINVEYYWWTMLIKYLFQYISKGTDHVVARIARNTTNVHGTGALESTSREPAVHSLVVDLQNMQRIVFKERDGLDSLVVNPHKKKTTLTEWLYYNEQNTNGRYLTYLNFPSEFVWYAYGKYWRHRRMRNKSLVGRLIFPGIRTVNDIVYPTCCAACEALGLLQDDQEWEITLEEAALTATPAELRVLLAHILAFCEVSDPKRLWQLTWRSMSEDIPYASSMSLNIPGLHIDDSELEDYVLYEFEGCLNHYSRSLTDFGLRLPHEHLMLVLRNRLLMEEKCYDRKLLATERDQLLPKLNEKQLYAILYTLRSEGKVVMVVASSGIASLLLLVGRTAHSRFKIPLDLTDTTDESPMNDRRCFKTLDKTLRDVLDEPNRIFGGKKVMLGDDFRQTLPGKKAATRDEIIRPSVAKYYLWPHLKVHYLTENM
ncbi:DNA helicase [Tanacetum coccineum]